MNWLAFIQKAIQILLETSGIAEDNAVNAKCSRGSHVPFGVVDKSGLGRLHPQAIEGGVVHRWIGFDPAFVTGTINHVEKIPDTPVAQPLIQARRMIGKHRQVVSAVKPLDQAQDIRVDGFVTVIAALKGVDLPLRGQAQRWADDAPEASHGQPTDQGVLPGRAVEHDPVDAAPGDPQIPFVCAKAGRRTRGRDNQPEIE